MRILQYYLDIFTLSDDKLTIGIILFDGNRYKIKFSDSKIILAKSLVDINKDLIDFVNKEVNKD